MITANDPILPSEAIRDVERDCGANDLMERAGHAAAAVALRMLTGRSGCVLVLAGPGNNGGDGFVVARLLREAGREVVLVCAADPESMPVDARVARQRWLDGGGSIVSEFVGAQWGLAIDAVFGIGLKRAPEGRHAEWIVRLNQLSCPVLALDVPSGLDADTGSTPGDAVRATHTATFIAWKPGLFTLEGPDHCGELSLHGLDLDPPESNGQRLAIAHFRKRLHVRAANSHKGHFGQAGVIGGATGMLGAPLLAARAALHMGAGRVYAGFLDPHAPSLDPQQPELMLRTPGDLHLMCSALAVGPGLGTSDPAGQQLRRALGFSGPLVLDADALNLIATHASLQPLLTQRHAETVLTPHPAEAARLMQCAVPQIQADRILAAQELARRFCACVVLKGAGSVVACPDGRWFINTNGNAGLATAGTGDVLTGFVLALLAQGWSAEQALLCAVHVHGAAADALRAQGIGPIGMTASELIPAARRVFNAWAERA